MQELNPDKTAGEHQTLRLSYKSGHNITKQLFGYGPWLEKKGEKLYKRKATMGILQGTGAYQCGRACIVIPENKLDDVSRVITRSGGKITSIRHNILRKEEFERDTIKMYCNNLKVLGNILKTASNASDVKEFKDSLDSSIRLAGKFEAYIRELSEYAEDKPEISFFQQIFKGLQSISETDLEAAKIQAEFLEKELENTCRSITKA